MKAAETEAAAQKSGTGSPPSAPQFDGFKPFRVHEATVQGGGVRAEAFEDQNFFVPVYDPTNPVADPDGMVAMPTVNLAEEIVNLKLAKHAYSANLEAFRTGDEMLGELLNRKT